MEKERLRVDCKIPNDKAPLHRVKSIGGETDNGESWRMDLDEAISRIEEDSLSLYTEATGMTAEITVGTTDEGTKFLKTLPDETDLNNIGKIGFCSEIFC